MKHELELKVQAWVDGETSEREAARIAEWVARDAEAGILAGKLRSVRAAMVDNEPIVPVPETREFHWSKIECQIQREEQASPRSPVSWAARWRRLMMPLGGVVALACVLALAVNQLHRPTFDEICSTDQGMEAVTFHDQSAGMTVVWLQDSSQTSDTTKPANLLVPDDVSSDVELE
jgi:hypothetical protein